MDKNIPPIPPEDLELIGRYSRKAIPPEELYTFPLILCDNEIDRDGEKFTVDSLAKLAEMFRGKTGIFDHNPSGKEQTARIYSASLETDPSRTAADGEPYTFVRAKAYMVRSEKNRDLIAEIDAGIKKETSVCCKVDAVRCSVCGRDIRRGPCPHEKGKEYDGKICCHLLCDPCDAYEWSFVAVPAQRNAGVTKSFQLSEEPPCGGVKLLRSEEPSCDGVKCIDSQCDSGSGESLRLSEMPSDDGVKSLRGEIAATAVKCNDESLRCGDASHPIVGADIIRPQQVKGKSEEKSPHPIVGADIIRPQQVRSKSEDESPHPIVGADIIRPQQVKGKSEEESTHPIVGADIIRPQQGYAEHSHNPAQNNLRKCERERCAELKAQAVGNAVLGVPHITGCGASPKLAEGKFHREATFCGRDFTERKALLASLLPKSAPAPKEDTSVYII